MPEDIKVMGQLALWIVLVIIGFIVFQKYKQHPRSSGGNDNLTITKAIQTGQKERVMIIQCNDTCYLVSNTPVSSTLLDKWPSNFDLMDKESQCE